MDHSTYDKDIAAKCLRAAAASVVDPELEPRASVRHGRRHLAERLPLMPFHRRPPYLDAEGAGGVGHDESHAKGASR
jgi:hypothetical protein